MRFYRRALIGVISVLAAMPLHAGDSGIRALDELPNSARNLLLQTTHSYDLQLEAPILQRSIDGFDYLYVAAAFRKSGGFESIAHWEYVLRTRHEEKDWRHSQLFRADLSLKEVFQMPAPDFLKNIVSVVDRSPEHPIPRS